MHLSCLSTLPILMTFGILGVNRGTYFNKMTIVSILSNYFYLKDKGMTKGQDVQGRLNTVP